MSSRPKALLTCAAAVVLVGLLAADGFAQRRPQGVLLRMLWPFFQQHRPCMVLPLERLIPPAPRPALVNVNSCTLEQLQGLPGVGPALGARIMAGRPYRNFEDLERNGVPLNTVERLRGAITFGP